ncbi:MAG: hypothetical protein NTX44_06205 [Ignavibacteriales bacterium]|nr:hypothetical protein [Ignavibacteriales bacterium]
MPHVTRQVLFSSHDEDDTFILEGQGVDLLNTQMIFIILNHQGDTLWQDAFSSKELIYYDVDEDSDSSTLSEVHRTLIKGHISHFFDDEHFRPLSTFPIGTIDTHIQFSPEWNNVSGDSTLIGFHYVLGEGINRIIAYSKFKKQAFICVTYYSDL